MECQQSDGVHDDAQGAAVGRSLRLLAGDEGIFDHDAYRQLALGHAGHVEAAVPRAVRGGEGGQDPAVRLDAAPGPLAWRGELEVDLQPILALAALQEDDRLAVRPPAPAAPGPRLRRPPARSLRLQARRR